MAGQAGQPDPALTAGCVIMIFNELYGNRSWFTFRIFADKYDFGGIEVYAFSGVEQVSAAYEFKIELVSRNSNLELTHALGKECLLTIRDKSGGTRLVHGVVRQMEQLHTANSHTHYLCHAVPRLWFLKQTRDNRIYQHQTVPEIIRDVLNKNNFLGNSYTFSLRENYQPREYCVQFHESDYHFLCRIAEEEGIHFRHEHAEDGHRLFFTDVEGGPDIPGESILRFYPGSGQPADTAVVSRLNLKHRVNSDRSTFREWNFTTPSLDLTAQQEEPDWEKAPMPQAMSLETYQFPHLYQERGEGERYARLQLARQLSFREWIECETDVARHTPGYAFTLHSHPRAEANRRWWLTKVRHEGKQPGVLEEEAPSGRGLEYKATFTAIPDDTRFVPEQKHKKARIEGLQSAIVTSFGSEEIFPDEYGRVKIRFHWDRTGPNDAGSSCWVRVADGWAGENFGFIQLPRVGQEVLVEFMEGDPDRPVITGRVYNAAKMPPWKLPKQKSLSGIQSKEIRGTQRNQLVFDDFQGSVQAQLSSDHDLSQLNLCYITRINHIEGREDFRGEGFELRTDGWGVVRAGKGLVLTTEKREQAQEHQKDIATPVTLLGDAAALHNEGMNQAVIHNTLDSSEREAVNKALTSQHQDIKGSGKKNGELAQPHLLVFSPAGVAVATPRSIHMETGEHTAITSAGHSSLVAGKNFLATALGAVRIFAHKFGIRLFSGQGKIEIQAQDNDIDLIAKRVLRLISTEERIEISAAKEILLRAGGSYLKISQCGIENGTTGRFVARASSHSFEGPASQAGAFPGLPSGATAFNDEYIVRNSVTGEPVANMRYELLYNSGETISGVTGEDGKIPLQNSVDPDGLQIKLLGVKG